MSWRTPAFPRPAFVFAFLGLATIGFLVHACTDPEPPATSKDITGPQLANNAASCTAPCLEVEVSLNAPGKPPAKNIVVTALVGGKPSAEETLSKHSGKAFHASTFDDGVATISLATLGLEAGELVGVCLIARSFNDPEDVQRTVLLDTDPNTTDELTVVPNNSPPGTMEFYEGAVTVANRSKSLTEKNFFDGCVNWSDPKDAPLSIDAGTAAKVTMSMNPDGAIIQNKCNGSVTGKCPTWAAIIFDRPLPWAPDLPPGVEQGLVVAGGSDNPAELKGLVCGQEYALETAEDAVTYSTVVEACKEGSSPTTAFLNPTLCVVNRDPKLGEPGDCTLDVTEGVDFICTEEFPIRDGVLGDDPLSSVLFEPSEFEFAIYYDQIYRDGSGEVTLHLRAKSDLLSPATLNHVVTKDFSDCPNISPVSESGSLTVTASCRVIDPEDPTTTRVTWLITVPDAGRTLEYRLDSAFDSYPKASRFSDTRSMKLITLKGLVDVEGQPGGDYCPLAFSAFGKSNDPKIWGSQID